MFAEPLSVLFVQQLVRTEAMSALPDAPVCDDRSRIGVAAQQTRLRLASSLRTLAAHVDPYAAARVSRTA